MLEMLVGLGSAAVGLRNYLKKDREEGGGVAAADVQAQAAAAAARAREVAAAEISAAEAAAKAAQEAEQAAAAVARYEKLQSVADAAYLIAAADGTVSDAETNKLREGLATYLGEEVGDSAGDLLEVARGRLAEKGQKGLAESIAAAFDADMRKVVFMVAAGISWLDRGIGVKEGLALQALSGAFGIPMNEMHKLLGAAKNV